jgi:hypothetical protein
MKHYLVSDRRTDSYLSGKIVEARSPEEAATSALATPGIRGNERQVIEVIKLGESYSFALETVKEQVQGPGFEQYTYKLKLEQL